MQISYATQAHPDLSELSTFLEMAFTTIANGEAFSEEQNQKLAEWFSVEEMVAYFGSGQLFEARTESGELVGAIFIGKQHPISWPDGHKMEIFMLAVHSERQGLGIARQLVEKAESWAKAQGAEMVIVNTHELMEQVHTVYRKLGYENLGRLEKYYGNGGAVFFGKKVAREGNGKIYS